MPSSTYGFKCPCYISHLKLFEKAKDGDHGKDTVVIAGKIH